MDYDEFLDVIGSFGKYQRGKYVLLCLPPILNAIITLAANYLSAVPDHRCFINGCDDVPHPMFDNPRCTNGTIPYDDFTHIGERHRLSQCRHYIFNSSSQFPPPVIPTPDNTTNTTCNKWVYDLSTYHNTTVTQWNLVCDKSYLHVLSETMFIVGILIGSIIFGNLGDRIGRRLTMFISILITVIIANLTSFAPLFPLYVVGRFCIGATLQGLYLTVYVMAVELVGPGDRVLAGTGLAISFAFGYFLLAPIAYFLRDWHYLHLATAAPMILMLIVYCYIPESIRWLLSKERYEEAERLAIKAACTNGHLEIRAPIFKRHEQISNIMKSNERNITIVDVLRIPPLFFRSINIFYMWIVASLVYYGLSLNISSLGGNVYVDIMLSGLVEAIGYAISIPILNKFGRKFPLLAFYLLCGIFLVSTAFTHEYNIVTIVLSLLGKLCICGAFADIYIYTGELYPTVVRNAALGTSSMFSRIGAVAAPYVDYSGEYIPSLPNLLFGGSALVAAVLSCFLPETIHLPLPETIQETLLIGKRRVGSHSVSGYRRISDVDDGDGDENRDDYRASINNPRADKLD